MCPRAVPLKAPITAIVDFFFSRKENNSWDLCISKTLWERTLQWRNCLYIIHSRFFICGGIFIYNWPQSLNFTIAVSIIRTLPSPKCGTHLSVVNPWIDQTNLEIIRLHPTAGNFSTLKPSKLCFPFLRWFHSLQIDSSCEDYLTLDLTGMHLGYLLLIISNHCNQMNLLLAFVKFWFLY